MLGFLNKLFGSKSDRDIKQIQPLVEQIKAVYPKLATLSDDELRDKTSFFKNKIKEGLAEIDQEVTTLKNKPNHQLFLSMPKRICTRR